MRKMKDSGIEWIGEIPDEWETWRIKHLSIDGLKYGANESGVEFDENLPRYIRITDISQDNKLKDDDKLSLPIDKAENYILEDGDVLFARSGATAGKSFYYSEKYGYSCFAGYMIRLRSDTSLIDSKLIYYYTLTFAYEEWIRQVFIQATIQNVSAEKYNNLYIPFSRDKNFQKKIVDYLDNKCEKIDSVIKAKEHTNEKLKEYRQSIIYEAVTKGLDKNVPMKDSEVDWIGKIPEEWEVKKLKFIGDSIIGITYSPNDITEEGLLVLRSSNVQKGKISYEDNVYVSKEVNEKLLVKKNDILICSRNGSKDLIGKCALIDDEAENSTFGAFMTIFRSEANKYIYYVFNSPIFSFHIVTFLTTTVNQLTISNLNNITIPIPTKSKEQQQIADYLDKKCTEIDTVISANEKTIEKLKEYRQSVIYEAVTGKTEIV